MLVYLLSAFPPRMCASRERTRQRRRPASERWLRCETYAVTRSPASTWSWDCSTWIAAGSGTGFRQRAHLPTSLTVFLNVGWCVLWSVSSVKSFGVVIESLLIFDEQVDKICHSVNFFLFFAQVCDRVRQSCDRVRQSFDRVRQSCDRVRQSITYFCRTSFVE